jgi:hypothetical protein
MKSLFTLLTKRGQLFALILAIVCIVIVFASIMSGLGSAGYDTSLDLVPIMQDETNTQSFNFFSPAVKIPSYLAIICFFIMILGVFKDIFSDPKGSMKMIIGLVVLAVVFFALYSSSAAENTGKISLLVQEFDVSDNVSKLISGGIKTTVGLTVVAAISMVLMELWNMFK